MFMCVWMINRKWSRYFAKWINKMEMNEQTWWITRPLSVHSAINHSSHMSTLPPTLVPCTSTRNYLVKTEMKQKLPQGFFLLFHRSRLRPRRWLSELESAAGWLELIRTGSENAHVCARQTVREKRLRPVLNVSQLIKAPADSLTAPGSPTSHSVSLRNAGEAAWPQKRSSME